MATGLEAMKIGSIIYFVPFFFLMNPSLVLQGDLSEFAMHITTALIGVALVCCGLQGYLLGVGNLRRNGLLEWPIRAALMLGGLMFIAPGGGLMPLSPLEMTGAAFALSVPAVLLSRFARRRAA